MTAEPDGSTPDLTTPEGVRAAIDNPDPVARNLQITQSYHELTLALDPLFGGADISWPAFATYASKQAGVFIRNEEVPAPLRKFLGLDGGVSAWSVQGLLRRKRFLAYIRVTVDDIAAHIGEGNRRVYGKLAPIYADFLALARAHPEGGQGPIDGFVAGLEDEPTTGHALRRAFTQYWTALGDNDAKLKAERILLGNLLVGWHEQIRLQEPIDGALSAPIHRALEDPDRRWTSLPVPAFLRWLGARLFRWLFAPAIRSFESKWKRVATECLMTLAHPGGQYRLGDDLPPLADGSIYPEVLREITLDEANELIAELDYTPGTTRGSGADDWTDLGDRMNYIVDFFRSRQRDRDLLKSPYTPQQAAAIRVGRVPDGPL